MSASETSPDPWDAAVVDVGSNSVRLVLYRVEGRAVWTMFNEKVLAGLGRDLGRTGRLSPDGVVEALHALRRFRAILDAVKPARIFTAATAAVREAKDGLAFCAEVETHTGLKLRVLGGEEEARFAALGVIAGAPDSRGLVGDLGGASLELVRLSRSEAMHGVSLPLGPFSMSGKASFDAGAVREIVNRHVEPIASEFTADTLNAVGGAWRNLALIHMRFSDYPLKIVHQYEISRRGALDVARFISQQSRGSLERIEGLSRRRVDVLPHAAVVLETLVNRLELQKVVISAFGLREGMLFQAMRRSVRDRDPLVEGCAAIGGRQGGANGLGLALERWLGPAFAKLDVPARPRDGVLVAAACRLADVGVGLHPDHRADLVFDQVLRAPIAGMNHAERAFLASAAYARHTSAVPQDPVVGRLLDGDRLQRARALGAAIRLGCDLSGGSASLLAQSRLDIRSNAVVLEAAEGWGARLLGEQTGKRAATLASLLDRGLKMREASGWNARVSAKRAKVRV
ncbi:MAG TPA: Ppx/GppA phosphatase family protein [Caulobacteraceae bacterium]